MTLNFTDILGFQSTAESNICITKLVSKMAIISYRNFKYLTISTFTLLYKIMVRSHLDYYNSVWI